MPPLKEEIKKYPNTTTNRASLPSSLLQDELLNVSPRGNVNIPRIAIDSGSNRFPARDYQQPQQRQPSQSHQPLYQNSNARYSNPFR